MQPFKRTELNPASVARQEAAIVEEYQRGPKAFCRSWGYPEHYTAEDILRIMAEVRALDYEIWINNRYQVNVSKAELHAEKWPEMIHLSIKRLDKETIHDWRELQTIKNEIVGVANEAVELYPDDRRVIDTANQYHLYVFKDPTIKFPFGWTVGKRDGSESGGSKQRPFNQ